MDILKLDYDKIKKLINLANKENIKLINKNKKNTLKKDFIIKSLRKIKSSKINQTKKKIKKNMKSGDIIKINSKLINDLQNIEDVENSISSINPDSLKNFSVYFADCFKELSSDSQSDKFIETFTN